MFLFVFVLLKASFRLSKKQTHCEENFPKINCISERKRSQSFKEDAGGHSALSEPQTVNTEEGEGGVTVAPEHPGETERTAKK